MVNRMRATRSHRNNRRSHHALDAARMATCSKCGSLHRNHHICTVCGSYKGRTVIDMTAKIAAKTKKINAKKQEAKK